MSRAEAIHARSLCGIALKLPVGLDEYIYFLQESTRTDSISPGSFLLGYTAQRLCVDCAFRFFVRLNKRHAGLLAQVKWILVNMTEKMQARHVQRR